MFWDSKIDSEFRKVWQILNRFCCKVKSCLGISSQGNPDLVLNQQGNWIETQSYKVYTALLRQSGGIDEQVINSGALTKGVTYYIDGSGGDFSNVGSPTSEFGTYFVATDNIEPTNWNGVDLGYNLGAPVVTVLENTIGNIWFVYDSDGSYYIVSDNLFIENKTFCQGTSTTENDGTDLRVITLNWNNQGVINLYSTRPIIESAVNDLLNNTPIEIRVYN
jgi:hypothetical protein